MKFGGDVDSFTDRKDIFAGWSTGEYEFNTLCDFEPSSDRSLVRELHREHWPTHSGCSQSLLLYSRCRPQQSKTSSKPTP